MRIFVAVAEEEGFAPAARRLGLSPPAVTRAVSALEERIGARLLHRTTRAVRLTDAGSRFLVDCKRILGELDEAEASAAGAHAEPRGQLGVTAPVLFGRMFVAPLLLDFLALHPQVTVRALLVDHIVDLMDEGLDVAVRIGHLPDSSFSAVRVGSVRRVVCASPDYLAARGVPHTPAALGELDVISTSPSSPSAEWTFSSPAGDVAAAPLARMSVNLAEVAIAAAVAGRGLTRVFSYQVAPELRAGRLRVVLEAFEPPPVPIHVVHAEGRRAPARVRAFVDFAAPRLRAQCS
jgi:DNA-binding transcriptional LysR family regulator